MTNETIRGTVVVVAITAVTILAAIDLLKGGDGATITGAFTAIGALVGYELGRPNAQTNSPA